MNAPNPVKHTSEQTLLALSMSLLRAIVMGRRQINNHLHVNIKLIALEMIGELNWLKYRKIVNEKPSRVVVYLQLFGTNFVNTKPFSLSLCREQKIVTKSHDDQQVNIQNLLPGKTYQFRVVANTNFGPGDSSEVYTRIYENISTYRPHENYFYLTLLGIGGTHSTGGEYCWSTTQRRRTCD